MVPTLVRNLRAGGEKLQVADEKMQRFLNVLYDLHMQAIKPDAVRTVAPGKVQGIAASPSVLGKKIANLHDFVAELVVGTWFAFDRDGERCNVRLSWISPWRATHIFSSRSGSEVMVFAPDELAWEMSAGRATLILEPVPLFDRAVSITLDYLAEQKAKQLPDARRNA
jgi:Protein of unknown function (DUF1631)